MKLNDKDTQFILVIVKIQILFSMTRRVTVIAPLIYKKYCLFQETLSKEYGADHKDQYDKADLGFLKAAFGKKLKDSKDVKKNNSDKENSQVNSIEILLILCFKNLKDTTGEDYDDIELIQNDSSDEDADDAQYKSIELPD